MVDEYNLEEISVEEGDISISIKGAAYMPVQIQTDAVVQNQMTSYYDEKDIVEEEQTPYADGTNLYCITSPLVGVFYSSPSPNEPNFVSIGDKIEIGTELGLIEAMKVFSPIPSDVAGEIVSVEVKSGELVTEGQVIMKIKKES